MRDRPPLHALVAQRGVALVTIVFVVLAILPAGHLSLGAATGQPGTSVTPSGKNDVQEPAPGGDAGDFLAATPEPGSRNAGEGTIDSATSGTAQQITPPEGSKNYGGDAGPTATPAGTGEDAGPPDGPEVGKNAPGGGAPAGEPGPAGTIAPAPGSKNDGDGSGIERAPGTTIHAVPEPGSKNGNPDGESALPDVVAAALQAGGSLISCGASANLNWTTTSGTYQVIRECTLSIPQNGWVFIAADASVTWLDGEYEANFEIGIDSTAGDYTVDRWVNIYDGAPGGRDKSVALSVLKGVQAGSHTFYFLGKRHSGPGTVVVYDPTLTAIYIPGATAMATACGASGNLTWETTSGTFGVLRECTMSIPQAGMVFLSANGSVGRANGEYEAKFRIGVDDPAGDYTVDRWVNVYDDAGDGTDESVALSVLKEVTPGSHTFYFVGARNNGTGTVRVYDPALTALFVPASSPVACGASGNATWTTTSGTFQPMRECTLSVPQGGWAILSASGSVGRLDGEFEARFRIGIDSTAGDYKTDRWVNVYDDSGDGTDKTMALTVLKEVAPGTHTFYLVGRRYDGAGTVLVYDPSLVVLAAGGRTFLPLILRH